MASSPQSFWNCRSWRGLTLTTQPTHSDGEDFLLRCYAVQSWRNWPTFQSAYCLHNRGALMMEVVRTSEESANFYQITRRIIPGNGHLHTGRLEDLKYHLLKELYLLLWLASRHEGNYRIKGHGYKASLLPDLYIGGVDLHTPVAFLKE